MTSLSHSTNHFILEIELALATVLTAFMPLMAAAEPHSEPDMDTRIDGIYAVRVVCPRNIPDCNRALVESIDRMTITKVETVNVDGSAKSQVVVGFSSTQTGDVVTTIKDVMVDPNNPDHIATDPNLVNPVIGDFDITVNPDTGKVEGHITDANAVSYQCSIMGRALQNLSELALPPNGAGDNNATNTMPAGVYSGNMGLGRIRIVIRHARSGRITGGYNDGGVTRPFCGVSWDEKLGLFRAQFPVARWPNHVGEIVLIFDKIHQLWRGYEYSAFFLNPLADVKMTNDNNLMTAF